MARPSTFCNVSSSPYNSAPSMLLGTLLAIRCPPCYLAPLAVWHTPDYLALSSLLSPLMASRRPLVSGYLMPYPPPPKVTTHLPDQTVLLTTRHQLGVLLATQYLTECSAIFSLLATILAALPPPATRRPSNHLAPSRSLSFLLAPLPTRRYPGCSVPSSSLGVLPAVLCPPGRPAPSSLLGTLLAVRCLLGCLMSSWLLIPPAFRAPLAIRLPPAHAGSARKRRVNNSIRFCREKNNFLVNTTRVYTSRVLSNFALHLLCNTQK